MDQMGELLEPPPGAQVGAGTPEPRVNALMSVSLEQSKHVSLFGELPQDLCTWHSPQTLAFSAQPSLILRVKPSGFDLVIVSLGCTEKGLDTDLGTVRGGGNVVWRGPSCAPLSRNPLMRGHRRASKEVTIVLFRQRSEHFTSINSQSYSQGPVLAGIAWPRHSRHCQGLWSPRDFAFD